MAWMDFFDSIRLLVTARIAPDLFEHKEKTRSLRLFGEFFAVISGLCVARRQGQNRNNLIQLHSMLNNYVFLC